MLTRLFRALPLSRLRVGEGGMVLIHRTRHAPEHQLQTLRRRKNKHNRPLGH